jgi:hypothetical protein
LSTFCGLSRALSKTLSRISHAVAVSPVFQKRTVGKFMLASSFGISHNLKMYRLTVHGRTGCAKPSKEGS